MIVSFPTFFVAPKLLPSGTEDGRFTSPLWNTRAGCTNSRFFGFVFVSESKISVRPEKWSASPWLTTIASIPSGAAALVPG